ncbi:MAG: glycosyltransferase family 2 protein [Bacteroidetes bacterium HGW-Bacteroidetes-4]|jgi:glycosyltransferase involved in cell wall biosynthesis|nr:MAG: glycosyltransferase family 2 protein [Bacteroidetes bacterium HGW-Bacteroidetes-4]
MIKLSVVIITLNEEKNIARCIKSVAPIADEVLVVDSYSSDNTKTICHELGVNFVEHPFDNFVAQKNFADQSARYNHILSIDADEELSEQLLASIKKVKENFTADAYEFNRLNNYCGKWIKHSGWYPDRKLRLYDRTKGHWGGVKIHEKIEMQAGTSTAFLNGNLLHYSYTSVQDHISQANRFSTLGAESSINKGRKANLIKVVLFPFWRFIRNYLLKLGFLDGYYGFVVCIIISHENFLKYVKMLELQKNKNV